MLKGSVQKLAITHVNLLWWSYGGNRLNNIDAICVTLETLKHFYMFQTILNTLCKTYFCYGDIGDIYTHTHIYIYTYHSRVMYDTPESDLCGICDICITYGPKIIHKDRQIGQHLALTKTDTYKYTNIYAYIYCRLYFPCQRVVRLKPNSLIHDLRMNEYVTDHSH